MKKKITVVLFVVLPLITGLVLYASSRSEAIYLNQFLEVVTGGLMIDSLQSFFQSINLPHWVIYSLPDGLWMLALVVLVLAIWNFKLNMQSLPWLVMAVLSGVMFEVFQGLGFLSGTFDVTDLILMMMAALLPVSFIILKMRLWKTN